MIARGGENCGDFVHLEVDFVHLEVGKWLESGRGAILPPKHELGSWQPPMAEMEQVRKRWRIMHKMEVHEVDGSFLEEAVIMRLQ